MRCFNVKLHIAIGNNLETHKLQVWANAVTSGLQISEARRKEANDFDIGLIL